MKARFTRLIKDGLRVALWATMLATVGAMLMFHVWNQYRIVQVGYKIAEVTHEHRKLLEQNKKLSIEAAVVGRTERLASVARERYGLAPVAPEQVRSIPIGQDARASLQ